MRKLAVLALILTISCTIMARNLTALIEPMTPVRWYAMNDAGADGDRVATLTDSSVNASDLEALGSGSDRPVWDTDILNGRPGVLFASESPLVSSDECSGYHFFVIARYNGSNFGAEYRGLMSDDSTNPILFGNNGSGTTFFDPTPVDVTYYKSQTEYNQNAMTAPFTKLELLELSNAAGLSISGFQLGRDRANLTRLWNGWIVEPMFFGAVLTSAQRQRVNLYYDLKYSLWKRSGVVQYALNFPTPTMLPELPYYHYREIPFDWSRYTIEHEYEDGGKSLIDTTDDPPRMWELEYTGLTPEEAEIFDAFSDAVRRKHIFNFEAKDGTVYSGVRVESYERSHEGNKSWVNNVRFTLAKYN